MEIDKFAGQYSGKGTWHEESGDSADYTIEQRIETDDRNLEIYVKHKHVDGTDSEITYRFLPMTPNIYRIQVGDSDVGRGFIVNDTISFYFNNKYYKADLESINQISFRMSGPTTLEGTGNCTGNSAGNYIMWRETLNRIDV